MMKEQQDEKKRFVSRKGTKRIAYNGDDRRTTTTEEEEEQSQPHLDDCGVSKRRRRTSPDPIGRTKASV